MAVAAVGMVELGSRIRVLKSQGQRVADVESTATQLVRAVDAIEPAAAVEMTPAQGVDDMRQSPYWGQRLGGKRARSSGGPVA
jgi:hypothetical protein